MLSNPSKDRFQVRSSNALRGQACERRFAVVDTAQGDFVMFATDYLSRAQEEADRRNFPKVATRS